MTQDSSRLTRVRRASLFGMAALLATLHAEPPAKGAALTQAKTRVPGSFSPGIHISGEASDALREFLIGGPKHWAVTDAPKFPKGLLIANKNGTLRDTPVTQFLVWKRDRHPIAFDRRHPLIAPLFKTASATQIRAQHLAQVVSKPSHTASFQVLIPPPTAGSSTVIKAGTSTAGGTPTTAAQVFAQPVPEPASALSTLALFGVAGVWWVRREGRATV